MVHNPYTAALLRHQDATRHLLPTRPTDTSPALTHRIDAFFAAMDIPHTGARMRVLTGIANAMDRADLTETVRRLKADRDGSLARLQQYANENGFTIPDVLISNAGRKHDKTIKLLERVLSKRTA